MHLQTLLLVIFNIKEVTERILCYMLEYKTDGFSVVIVDNIDFVYTQARISKGKNDSSWHGTSIQVVQPLPSLSNQMNDFELILELLTISVLKRARGSPCPSPQK